MHLKVLTGIAVSLIFFSAVYHVNDCAFQVSPVFLYNAESMGTAEIANGEWLPQGVDSMELKYHEPVAEDGLLWKDYEKKGTSIDVFVENTASGARYLELPLTGYKGYSAEGTEDGGSLAIAQERGAHGDLRIEVPGGYRGKVHVSYKGSVLFHIAEMVSLISILLVLGGKALQKRKVRNGRKSA